MACRHGDGASSVERPRVFYWSEDTASRSYHDGVQRAVRCLGRALPHLGVEVVPVGWDGERRVLQALTAAEQAGFGIGTAAAAFAPRRGDWLLIPEIPARAVGHGIDPVMLARAYGLRTAVLVHDLIPLKHRHLYEPRTVSFYRTCFRAFAAADLLIVTTRYVAADLAAWLRAENARIPEMVVCPLAAQLPGVARRLRKAVLTGGELRLLTVSRWEPRKNLPRLLDALARLAGLPNAEPIQLTIVGRRGGCPDYEVEVATRLTRLPNVTVRPSVDDLQLAALHDAHHATVYPSYEEGFGLPILESLWLATPCLCHAGSAMAEIAPGGGTIMVDMTNEAAIADALARLAVDPALLRALADEAVGRDLRTWLDTARAVASSLGVSPPRASLAGKTQLDLADVFC